jgi:hypothetical protein
VKPFPDGFVVLAYRFSHSAFVRPNFRGYVFKGLHSPEYRRDYLSRAIGTRELFSAYVRQLTILGMAGRRRPSTPKQYREELLRRTESARLVAGLSREQVVEELSRLSGTKVKLATYKKWETRTPLPHHLIIPFCDITGADPYMLLTGQPFRLGRSASPRASAAA